MNLTPIVVGIWDSGTDISLYKSQMVSGQPGIAFDLHSNSATGHLHPLIGGKRNAAALPSQIKGYFDLQASIGSLETTALRTKLSGLSSTQVQPFLEGLNQFALYAHGTHVSGIALRGNPAARLPVCRFTVNYRLVPETPTVAQAERDAALYRQTVACFKARGVRVVNMSWIEELHELD